MGSTAAKLLKTSRKVRAKPSANGKADPPPANEHLTDLGNARRLVRDHGRDLRHCHPWRKWLVWDERRWKLDDSGEPARRAKAVVWAMFDEAIVLIREAQAELKSANDDEEKERAATAKLKRANDLMKWAVKSESRERLAAVITVGESEPGVPILPADLDADRMLLNCANGTVDLRTGELREHRREDRLTALCPTAFDPDAKCPEWERALSNIFPATGDAAEEPGNPQLIGFVQRLIGYCLTGSVDEQVLPILWGGGANGKTTVINAVADTVGPDYIMRAPPGFLMLSKSERHPTELADLFGKRLVAMMESAEGRRLDEESAKALTGGDRIRARRMREDFWEFAPTHKIIVCTNHRPKIRGTDHGIWRRLRLVPFTAQFWNPDEPAKAGEDRPEHLRQDKQLAAKLRAQAPGILAWLVRGCLTWQREGLGNVEDVGTATADYRAEQDLLAAFLAECCLTGKSEYKVRSTPLYEAFRKWAEAGGERAVSRRDFGTAMTERGYDRFTNNGTWYRGVMLAENGTTEGYGT